MSISGLHVTLVSGLAAWLVAFGWRRVPRRALRLPARKAAAVAAIVAALGYTLLAGFAVPAQRTFYMVTVVALALWCGRIASPVAHACAGARRDRGGRSVGAALAGPVAVVRRGGADLLRRAGWTGRTRVVQWARMQWAITVGLAPAALLLFGQVSVAGPLANAVAIPRRLGGGHAARAASRRWCRCDSLLELAAWLVAWLLEFLEWCAALPGALWQQHVPPLWTVLLALAGAAWLLAPRGVPGAQRARAHGAGVLRIVPPRPPRARPGSRRFDVGQGLAVLVRTASRTLLYDAGPAYGPEADSGGRIVVPALRGAGIGALDLMVLSHEDIDHIGGALTVLETLRGATRSPLRCRAAHALNALVPRARGAASPASAGTGTACASSSCTRCRRRSSAAQQPELRAAHRRRRRCDAAHRATSSAPPRRSALGRSAPEERTCCWSRTMAAAPPRASHSSPRWRRAGRSSPAGYRNRFGHPTPRCSSAIEPAGVRVLRTDLDGAVTCASQNGDAVETERQRRGRVLATMIRAGSIPLPRGEDPPWPRKAAAPFIASPK